MNLETIVFENNTLKIIDQMLLPYTLQYTELNSLEAVIEAIKSLKVRGAPAIGITAAYGLFVYANNLAKKGEFSFPALRKGAAKLKKARPTAVNLSWAIDRMVASVATHEAPDVESVLKTLRDTALSIHLSDKETCTAIGRYGAQLLADESQVITHCNTGALATGGIGTALGIVYEAVNQGKKVHVFVDETRPVGQGARLTYWELQYNRVSATLITDNMAGLVMRQEKIDAILVGADRIAANGDVANKIGTYGLAVLAKHHGIPFYVAAPLSSFDFSITDGKAIPIEQRPKEEVLDFWRIPEKADYKVYNPAFDITPAHLISGIITEKGVVRNPDKEELSKLIIH